MNHRHIPIDVPINTYGFGGVGDFFRMLVLDGIVKSRSPTSQTCRQQLSPKSLLRVVVYDNV